MSIKLMPALERRLRAELSGEVCFDRFGRGRYATDASHYQVMPVGVVVPRTIAEAERAIAIARAEGVSVLARGAGTSQAGQAVNASLVIDCSRHLDQLLELDVGARRAVVEPGIVLDELNRRLRPHGLWFPVDISTASRATIGGMAANNSCGTRSLRYGTMRDNVRSIDAIMADGMALHFGPLPSDPAARDPALAALAGDLLALGRRHAEQIASGFPKLHRRVGGYNLDALLPGALPHNLAHVLVGSEGTLAFFTRVELQLSPLLGHRVVGACHFGGFYQAMASVQHLVQLAPIAVELIDRSLIELAADIAVFAPTLQRFVRGRPEAILLVEFAEPDPAENHRRLAQLHQLMGELGFAWDHTAERYGGVVDVVDPGLQRAITDLRTSGLNVMMSMKAAGKPVSFIEDCAVPLEHLADYTERLSGIFARHGTSGTWYAHAGVGCLHVRPILNLRLEQHVNAMRAIAEEALALVRHYQGSHSGEHGDGIVRSEFHERMFGPVLCAAFEEVKDRFDPAGLFNPGRVVRAPKFDDVGYFRYGPQYRDSTLRPRLDWSAYPGGGAGLQGAVEMCNNNGACRNLLGGVMCPSFRVTRAERDVTRGRANSLRLALSGQLGADALASDEMAATLGLCVSCKACRRECPTGVDMARMKLEVLAARAKKHGLSRFDYLIGWLPRYAPLAARMPWLFDVADRLPGARRWAERITGLSARRSLPRWRPHRLQAPATPSAPETARELVLFVDTFNRYFEPEIIEAALAVLTAAGYRVHLPEPVDGKARPLCCGRTFLAIGAIEQARYEAERVINAVAPLIARGLPLIGLEPSCLLSFRDEIPALLASPPARRIAEQARMFEEFLLTEHEAGRLLLQLAPIAERALLHGHCHQKAFGALGAIEKVLAWVPQLAVQTVDSTCCGMAGAFGFNRETIDVSLAMGELSLLPAVRAAPPDTLIVADGTSCRHQLRDGTGRVALHVAGVLASSLAAASGPVPARTACARALA